MKHHGAPARYSASYVQCIESTFTPNMNVSLTNGLHDRTFVIGHQYLCGHPCIRIAFGYLSTTGHQAVSRVVREQPDSAALSSAFLA